jgi:hypothetical protein
MGGQWNQWSQWMWMWMVDRGAGKPGSAGLSLCLVVDSIPGYSNHKASGLLWEPDGDLPPFIKKQRLPRAIWRVSRLYMAHS